MLGSQSVPSSWNRIGLPYSLIIHYRQPLSSSFFQSFHNILNFLVAKNIKKIFHAEFCPLINSDFVRQEQLSHFVVAFHAVSHVAASLRLPALI